MEHENTGRRRGRKPRQHWNPHWIVKILYGAWMTLFTAAKVALGALATVLLIVLVCGFVFVGILGDYLEEDVLPDSASYEFNIADKEQTSYVYYVDKNGDIQLLQQIHTTIDRQWVRYEDIPEELINAAIAIEDKRFHEHQGVDWITTVKACLNMFMGGSSQFGGSTITQQLVKNDTGEKSVTVQRKVAEIFRAQYAEKLYDKETIMEYYLNSIYFGRGCYGVKSAAEEYFGKELQSMTIAECASLIGITNNPSLYNPYSESEYEFRDQGMTVGRDRNIYRQHNILGQMLEQGMITEAEYEEAMAQELVFKSGIAEEDKWEHCDNESCDYEGTVSTYMNPETTGYYCPVCGSQNEIGNDASQEVYSYFVDTVLEDVARDMAAMNGVDYDSLDFVAKKMYNQKIQQGGYHIYSTLDMDVQKQIDLVYTNLSEIPTTSSSAQLQSGMVVIDNRTGDIVGIAGGVGEKIIHDALNRATDSKLQTGSSMKPVAVYGPAFESGVVSPASPIKDMPITYAGGNYPKNDNRRYDLWRNVFNGVRLSVNTISIGTLQKVGFEYSFSFAQNGLGLEHLVREYPLSNGENLTDLGYSPLGMGALTVGATVREMPQAYATFANMGVWREARTYTKVYDSEGNLVLDNTQDSRKVMGEKAINYLNYCLYHAANGGTGTAALFNGMTMNIAGKTGTTSSNRDRWFCGFTPYYTAAVWCGFDQPEQIRLTGYDQSNPACRLWKKVLQPLHVGKENKPLYDGSRFVGYNICLDTGKIATAACSKDVRGGTHTSFAYCYSEDITGEACDQHVLVDYCVTGGGVATEWCRKFADVKISQMSLVKRNKAEIDELKRARTCGLEAEHTLDNYIWYTEGNWHGFSGKLQPDVNAPYIICPMHTKEAWEEKQREEEEKKEEEEDQEETTDPNSIANRTMARAMAFGW